MYMEINEELKKYIEENILTQYNLIGNLRKHVETVIERSFELAETFKLDVNPDILYTIAAFHDIGYKIDPEKHEIMSSEIFFKDKNMNKFFNEKEKQLIAEAIIDHRGSSEDEPRSIYGKLISSADREFSADNLLKSTILYQADKHKSENLSNIEIIEISFKKILSKYGKDCYAKMYYPDKKYKDFIEEIQELLENKEKFVKIGLDILK